MAYYAPCLTGITPNQGPAGTVVTLQGRNLYGITSVTFGSTSVPFTPSISGGATVVAPPGSGTVAVTVTANSGGRSVTSSLPFTYTTPLTGIEPSQGPASGGTTVHITGPGLSGATAVEFAGIEATSFHVESETAISAVTRRAPSATRSPESR